MMIDANYSIEALRVLLNEDCLLGRYFPLIGSKEALIAGLTGLGCVKKDDIAAITDDVLLSVGLPDRNAVSLFRRFLTLYDVRPEKMREIPGITYDLTKQAAYRELYLLPGVKATRAELYRLSGYSSLYEIAKTNVEEVQTRTSRAIDIHHLPYAVPLPKEIRTHIAVAKAFTGSIPSKEKLSE